MGNKRKSGTAQSHCGAPSPTYIMDWTPLLLLFLFYCTGRGWNYASIYQELARQHKSISFGQGLEEAHICPLLLTHDYVCLQVPSPSLWWLNHPTSLYLLEQMPDSPVLWAVALHSDYHISWYQQKTGIRPQFLLRYYSDLNKQQGSGVPNRFVGSKDPSANAGILFIYGLQYEDEADSYCQADYANYGSCTVLKMKGEVRLKCLLCSLCNVLSQLNWLSLNLI